MTSTEKNHQHFQENAQRAAALLRAMSNENRLLILCHLIECKELSVGALLEQSTLSQSALSQHLAKMRDEGLITYRRVSQTLFYRIDDEKVEKVVATLKSIFCP